MKNYLGLLIVLLASICYAQETTPSIVTDRPTQSAASTVVAKGDWLLELGFIREKATADVANFTYGNMLLRYGVIDGVELRVTQDYLGFKDDATNDSGSGLGPLTLGTKVHLVNENGIVPQMSIIGQVTLSNGDEAFKPAQATPELRLNFSNTLSDKLSLGYNVGMRFPEDNTTTFYSAVLGYALAEGWTVFAEPYGFLGDGNSDHRFNTGLIYLVNSTLQFDVSAGWGLSDISPDSFIGFGLAVGF